MSIDGTVVFTFNDANATLYGREVKPSELLHGSIDAPAESQVLIDALKNAELEPSAHSAAQPAAQPAQPTQPAQPAQPAQPTQPTQPTQPLQPVQPIQPIQPVQPTEPTQPSTSAL